MWHVLGVLAFVILDRKVKVLVVSIHGQAPACATPVRIATQKIEPVPSLRGGAKDLIAQVEYVVLVTADSVSSPPGAIVRHGQRLLAGRMPPTFVSVRSATR
jgi:hypothetical protein